MEEEHIILQLPHLKYNQFLLYFSKVAMYIMCLSDLSYVVVHLDQPQIAYSVAPAPFNEEYTFP